MQQNHAQDTDALIRIKDLKQKAEEYRMESRSMKITLNFVGLTFDKLSELSWKYLHILLRTAELLKLAQPSDTNYLLGLIQLQDRMEACRRCQSQMKLKIARLEPNKPSLETLELQLQNLRLGPIFIRTNTGRYLRFREHEEKLNNVMISKNMKRLKSNGASSSVSHQRIVAKKRELDWIVQKCLEVRVKLGAFRNIPPSFSKIEVAVKEMEGESQQLQSELACCLDYSVL